MKRSGADADVARHGEIVTITYPALARRRRWCATCYCWTWEVGLTGSGVFRHGQKRRTKECKR